jgi:hypothetical protein
MEPSVQALTLTTSGIASLTVKLQWLDAHRSSVFVSYEHAAVRKAIPRAAKLMNSLFVVVVCGRNAVDVGNPKR